MPMVNRRWHAGSGAFRTLESLQRLYPSLRAHSPNPAGGCLQSKPAGEVIDSATCLSRQSSGESENTTQLVAAVPPECLVHKAAHTHVHHDAQRQEGEQHRRSAVTH